MEACTAQRHIYTAWMLGTPCQCGATEVVYRPELGAVRAEPVAGRIVPPAGLTLPTAQETTDAEVAADAVQAEGEADEEADKALGGRRKR